MSRFPINGILVKLVQPWRSGSACPMYLLRFAHAWQGRTPASQQRGVLNCLGKINQPVRILYSGDIKDRLNLIDDDGVPLGPWTTWHPLRFTILLTGNPMLISRYRNGIFLVKFSCACGLSSLPKSWIVQVFFPSSIWHGIVFSLLCWIPLSEVISITAGPPLSSLAMVQQAGLVTPAVPRGRGGTRCDDYATGIDAVNASCSEKKIYHQLAVINNLSANYSWISAWFAYQNKWLETMTQDDRSTHRSKFNTSRMISSRRWTTSRTPLLPQAYCPVPWWLEAADLELALSRFDAITKISVHSNLSRKSTTITTFWCHFGKSARHELENLPDDFWANGNTVLGCRSSRNDLCWN